MATTKKNTKNTETTKMKTIETPITETPIVKEVQVKESVSNKIETPAREYQPTDEIMCRSITSGELIFCGKSGTRYSWINSGDIVPVEYQDLRTARLSKSQFLFDPLFVIEDEELLTLKEWKDIAYLYESMYDETDLSNIFNLSATDLQKVLPNLPKGAQNSIRVMAAERIETGELDSISKIKAIDFALDTELMTFLERD